jgi:hypothetical protein
MDGYVPVVPEAGDAPVGVSRMNERSIFGG